MNISNSLQEKFLDNTSNIQTCSTVNNQLESSENLDTTNKNNPTSIISQQNNLQNSQQQSTSQRYTLSKKLDFYKPFQSPPDFQMAEQHLKAKRVGKINYKQWRREINKSDSCCKCCSLPFKKEEFKLNCNTNELKQLGFGVSKFFDYVKYMIVSLLIVTAISGVYTYASQVHYCLNHYQKNGDDICLRSMGIIYSFQDLENNSNQESRRYIDVFQAYLNIATGICTILYFLFVTKNLTSQSEQYEKKIDLPSQYTLMAYNIDPQQDEWNLKSEIAFQSSIPLESIVRIVYTYKINDYLHNLEKQDKLLIQQKKLQNFDYSSPLEKQGKVGKKIHKFQQQWAELQDQIQNFEQGIQNEEENTILKNNIAFITFSTKSIAKKCLKNLKLNFYQKHKNMIFKETQLYVKHAPEPLDIIWENLEISQQKKFFFRVRGKIVAVFMIIISFVIVAILTRVQAEYFKAKEEFEIDDANMYFSLLISISIGVANILMALVNDYLVTLEKYNSYTQLTQSNAWTLSWMDFSNMAFVPTFLFFVNRLSPTQMIHNTFVMFLANTFLIPTMLFINFPYLISKMRQKLLKKQGMRCKLNQQQAHQVFEDPTFMMERKYCVINSSYLYSMFYAAIFPIGIVYGIIVLGYTYWVSKYNLVKKTQLPNSISDNIIKKMMHVAACGPLMFALGCAYNLKLSQTSSELIIYTHSIINYVLFGFSFLFLFFRKRLIHNSLFSNKNKQFTYIANGIKEKEFKQIKKTIGIDYDIANPILGENGTESEFSRNQSFADQYNMVPKRSINVTESNTQYLLNFMQQQELLVGEENINQKEISQQQKLEVEITEKQNNNNNDSELQTSEQQQNTDLFMFPRLRQETACVPSNQKHMEKQNNSKCTQSLETDQVQKLIKKYNITPIKDSTLIPQNEDQDDNFILQDKDNIVQSEIIQELEPQHHNFHILNNNNETNKQSQQTLRTKTNSSVTQNGNKTNKNSTSVNSNEDSIYAQQQILKKQQLRGYAMSQTIRRRQTSINKSLGLTTPTENIEFLSGILNPNYSQHLYQQQWGSNIHSENNQFNQYRSSTIVLQGQNQQQQQQCRNSSLYFNKQGMENITISRGKTMCNSEYKNPNYSSMGEAEDNQQQQQCIQKQKRSMHAPVSAYKQLLLEQQGRLETLQEVDNKLEASHLRYTLNTNPRDTNSIPCDQKIRQSNGNNSYQQGQVEEIEYDIIQTEQLSSSQNSSSDSESDSVTASEPCSLDKKSELDEECH